MKNMKFTYHNHTNNSARKQMPVIIMSCHCRNSKNRSANSAKRESIKRFQLDVIICIESVMSRPRHMCSRSISDV